MSKGIRKIAVKTKYFFRYREFYDVPRVILIALDFYIVRLESIFDDVKDDYNDYYSVKITNQKNLPEEVYWSQKDMVDWKEVGQINVSELHFDSAKRVYFVSSNLDVILDKFNQNPDLRRSLSP